MIELYHKILHKIFGHAWDLEFSEVHFWTRCKWCGSCSKYIYRNHSMQAMAEDVDRHLGAMNKRLEYDLLYGTKLDVKK